MDKKFRLAGMWICLGIMALAVWFLSLKTEMSLDLAALLTMFVGGYGLRESLDHLGDIQNVKIEE